MKTTEPANRIRWKNLNKVPKERYEMYPQETYELALRYPDIRQ